VQAGGIVISDDWYEVTCNLSDSASDLD